MKKDKTDLKYILKCLKDKKNTNNLNPYIKEGFFRDTLYIHTALDKTIKIHQDSTQFIITKFNEDDEEILTCYIERKEFYFLTMRVIEGIIFF